MPNDLDAVETTVLATYSTRRDAEVAREYLADAEIQAFVSSDDAGGMYPQMQRPNGVKLIGMADTASEAQAQLEEAGLYPAPPESSSRTEGLGTAVYTIAVLLAGVAVILVLLMIAFG